MSRRVYVVTYVDLASDPTKYDAAIAAYSREEDALRLREELTAELEGTEGIQYYVENVPLDDDVEDSQNGFVSQRVSHLDQIDEERISNDFGKENG